MKINYFIIIYYNILRARDKIIMSILTNKKFQKYIYKYFPPFLISYILYKRYKITINKTRFPPPLELGIYERDVINYNYDCIRLSHGNVHYRTNIINGNLQNNDDSEKKQVYLFIHSENGSMYDFKNMINSLNSMKQVVGEQRVKYYYICVDLYGYGYSQYDNTPQTIQLYISQICELLYSLNVNVRINVVGYSMGAAISAGFAATYPLKIKSLVLLSPNGYKEYRENNTSWFIKYIKNNSILTLLSVYYVNFYTYNEDEYRVKWNDVMSTECIDYVDNNKTYYNNIELNNTIYDKILSKNSYIRNFPIGEIEYVYKYINENISNILIVWGENDDTNKQTNLKNVNKILYNSQIINYSNYKQFYPLEHGNVVMKDIVNWVTLLTIS